MHFLTNKSVWQTFIMVRCWTRTLKVLLELSCWIRKNRYSRAVILFRDVEHCGTSSSTGINCIDSGISSNLDSIQFRNRFYPLRRIPQSIQQIPTNSVSFRNHSFYYCSIFSYGSNNEPIPVNISGTGSSSRNWSELLGIGRMNSRISWNCWNCWNRFRNSRIW